MIVKRLIAAALALCLGSMLGSCGGASENGFSSFVADHWPHWAGGMPDDVPPRPGDPGYAEFIAHGQADQDAMKPPATGAKAAVAAKTAAQPPPAAQVAPAVQVAPADNPPSEDSSVVPGGLY